MLKVKNELNGKIITEFVGLKYYTHVLYIIIKKKWKKHKV